VPKVAVADGAGGRKHGWVADGGAVPKVAVADGAGGRK
jgi:hypothetical protein